MPCLKSPLLANLEIGQLNSMNSDQKTSRDELLVKLHEATLKAILEKVESGEATAQELNVARQFLQDNGIQSLLESTPEGKGFLEAMGKLPFTPAR